MSLGPSVMAYALTYRKKAHAMTLNEWIASDAPPTWLAVVGTSVAVWFTYRAYHRERERDIQNQASHIAVWPNKSMRQAASLGIVNSSSAPVWEVFAYAYRWERKGVQSDSTISPTGIKFDIGVTPPFGQARYFNIGPEILRPVDYQLEGYFYALSFRDSANRRWHRTGEGELSPGEYSERDAFPTVISLSGLAGHGDPSETSHASIHTSMN